ncbi:hypothetical protein B296_00007526 [Ensete ventricosum]|uniref:Uncharacterized protein n=1 Tax=Ensete ventricosum TaxID=4639 RepID=A0A426ZNY2_ENSVE|nr:hypothetical protein B296_00007526 [Ensete ventricosum]
MTDPKPTSRRVGRRNGGSPREMAGTRTAGAVQLEVGHPLALNSRREHVSGLPVGGGVLPLALRFPLQRNPLVFVPSCCRPQAALVILLMGHGSTFLPARNEGLPCKKLQLEGAGGQIL